MQIQRIQTLYLLIAAILTGMFCFLPYATVSVSDEGIRQMLVTETPVLFILNATITVLLLITIFMYRNLKQQIKLALIDALLILGSVATTLLYIYVGHADAIPAFNGGAILLALAFAFTIAARRAMKRDKAKLSSADRLWK